MKKQQISEVKQLQKIAGILKETWHPDDPSSTEIDDTEEDPDDFDDISEEEVGDDKEHYENTQQFLDVVFDIVNDEMRAGYFSEKGLDRVDAYLTKHGEALFKSGKSAEDVAEALMAKFTTARP